MSLPHYILNIVERKEQLYRNFSSQEMIDLYLSQTQAKKYDNESIYNVYATIYRSGNEKTHNHVARKNGYRRNMKEIKVV